MKIKYILQCCLWVCLIGMFSGCQKNEFMPPPEGEKVPYDEPASKDLETLLKESPYQLFYTAWQRSHMQHLLDSLGSPKVQFTLLVPDDAALEATGLTAAAIHSMPVAKLDNLLRFYTLRGKVTSRELAGQLANYTGITLLEHPGLITNYFLGNGTSQTQFDPYYYRQYLALDGDKLLVNGVETGAGAGMLATNGFIWPLNRVIPRPDKTFLEVLEEDPRFSMFVELQRKTDSITDLKFRQVYMDYMGWDPGPGISGKDFTMWLKAYDYGYGPSIGFNTLFAPVNEAFSKAGFHSVDELLKWNERAAPFYFDEQIYNVAGAFPTDTLVSFLQDWGRIMVPYSPIWGPAPNPMPTVFYKNELNNALLADYFVNVRGDELQYKMPLDYATNGSGQVQVKVKGSSYPAATITESINTLMGPLHVVDRLLVPNDFKLK